MFGNNNGDHKKVYFVISITKHNYLRYVVYVIQLSAGYRNLDIRGCFIPRQETFLIIRDTIEISCDEYISR